MNKTELIDVITSESGLSKADAAHALSATTDTISGAMAGKTLNEVVNRFFLY